MKAVAWIALALAIPALILGIIATLELWWW